jgi:hypothetical protein
MMMATTMNAATSESARSNSLDRGFASVASSGDMSLLPFVGNSYFLGANQASVTAVLMMWR